MNALQIARQEKKRIEAVLEAELNKFTAETGLVVRAADLTRIDVTAPSDETERYMYRVECEILVE